jgi:DNA replication protein
VISVDWKLALVKNYKKMDLNENELSMIFVVDSLLQDGETFITPDMLSLQMTLPFEQIDSCFTALIKRCYLSYDKSLKLSLDNLISILNTKYPTEISIETEVDENEEVIHLFENEFARALSETEVSKINEWIKNGNTIAKIKEALNLATMAKAKSIRYIDKILLEWQRKEEFRTHGKTISDKWGKNLEETLEIAKINWIED